MDRREFERLRDLPGKKITGDIRLQRSRETAPLLSATVLIENSADVTAKLFIEFNEQTDAKILNVSIPGTGPICRLEVDTRSHKSIGRSHKHALHEMDCPALNLPREIQGRSDLSGKSFHEVFMDFCDKANIEHDGSFVMER
jgi:hypothetical protein